MTYKEHFDWVAKNDAKARRVQGGFHEQIAGILRFHISEGSRVLEWGCGRGDLLSWLKPSRGLGVDLSPNMVAQAQAKYAADDCLEFREGELCFAELDEKFDAIILDYLPGYLKDIHECFSKLKACCHSRTRIYVLSLSHLYRPCLALGERLGWVMKHPEANWLSKTDLCNILELNDFEVITKQTEQIVPFQIPLVSGFFNRFLVRLPFFRHLGITNFIVARPQIAPELGGEISCSVVVPARNESGNIQAALDRIPVMGKGTEVIFVEGNSTDDTWEVIQERCAAYDGPHQVKYLQQPGKGKWDAVYAGFGQAKGDILVIQDADLTAPPEDLPKFFEAVSTGRAEFANGCRLVYPMESQAMRFLNLLGNKFFAVALSFVLGQGFKDSLCGTKMLLRSDYERLLKRIEVLGDFDPFGDFNLLFGSSMLDLKIRDILVRYRDRQYGDTNISRFSHGWILLKMTWFGLRKVKFFSFRKC